MSNETMTTKEIPAAETRTAAPKAWRSLEELAAAPGFEDTLQREFPRQAAEWGNLDRRRFLQLSGASLGLAGLTACTKQPPEKVIPYVRAPEDVVPGKPLFYATSVEEAGYAQPVLAESHMGRPTKVEGNPEHPASLGGTTARTQASVLELYDPDRSQAVTHLGQIRSWSKLVEQIASLRQALQPLRGAGLAIVSGTITSPTQLRLLSDLLAELPQAKWYEFDAAGVSNQRAALDAAAGRPVSVRYDLEQADVVLAVDSDFLNSGPGAVAYAKAFGKRRRPVDGDAASMSRLYALETMPTGTSTVADHRLALKPTRLRAFLEALGSRLGAGGNTAAAAGAMDEREQAWLDEVAADLRRAGGRAAVIVGEHAPAAVQRLGFAINRAIGSIGTATILGAPVAGRSPSNGSTLRDFAEDAAAGRLTTAVFLDVNPVYSAPADLLIAEAIDRVGTRIHLGSHIDETGERCQWHVPKSHALESWGDLRSFDGIVTLCQPIVDRLYDSFTSIDLLGALLGQVEPEGDAAIRATWSSLDDRAWRRALHDGMIADAPASSGSSLLGGAAATLASTASDALGAEPELGAAVLAAAPVVDLANGLEYEAAVEGDEALRVDDEVEVEEDGDEVLEDAGEVTGGYELIFRPDPTIGDGRWANNGWLQELPKPITKLTWDNALMASPSTARKIGLEDLYFHGDFKRKVPRVRLEVGDRKLDLPLWIVPGLADDALVLHLGYGRRLGGAVAAGAGFDANLIRSAASPWQEVRDVRVREIGGTFELACTQDHFSMEGRHPVQETTVQQIAATPDDPLGIHLHVDPSKSMMDERGEKDWVYDTYAWAMSIDLTSCTSCNACVTACVAENNIPVVGKDQVARGREMHWIRVDRYFVGDDPNEVEAIAGQPLPCMQCEQAPCEVVCPVAATVHSDEGLNDMVYNRCVGTRYCSNNCPYKVRRFNFLLYQDFDTPQLKLGRNPDVTVRSRGVMEKCTYCVQRINGARHEAKVADRKIRDGDVVTACQQACPSDAIVFGDLSDPTSPVSERRRSELDYSLLADLGTRPRTTYLGRVRNPNPELWARLYPGRPLVREAHGHHGDESHGADTHDGDSHGAGGDHGRDHSSPVDHHGPSGGAEVGYQEHGTGLGTDPDHGAGTEIDADAGAQ